MSRGNYIGWWRGVSSSLSLTARVLCRINPPPHCLFDSTLRVEETRVITVVRIRTSTTTTVGLHAGS